MWFHKYNRKLRIWEIDYGRDAGWVIEREGVPLAVLTEPRWEEMFWVSYRIEAIATDPVLREQILSHEFWAGNAWAGLVWRSQELGDVAEFAFPAGSPFPEPGRLTMRGLYLQLAPPSLIDEIVLFVRRWLRHRRSGAGCGPR